MPLMPAAFGTKIIAAQNSMSSKMLAFDALTQAYSLASQDPYKTELGNKGFTVADANLLRDLAVALDEKKIPQVNAGNVMRVSTSDRIVLHNKMFETMRTLKTCTRLVFRDDYALGRFLIYMHRITEKLKLRTKI
jgi:hypothetical protein